MSTPAPTGTDEAPVAAGGSMLAAPPPSPLPSPPPLAVLEPALWQRLNEATAGDDLATAWLALQCGMIANAVRGDVRVPGSGNTPLRLLAAWPDAKADVPALRSVSATAFADKRPVAHGALASSETAAPAVSFPILIDGTAVAVVSVELRSGAGAVAKDDLRAAIRQLQWGSAWLRDHLRGARAADDAAFLARTRATLDLLAAVLDHRHFATAAMAAATEMAVRFDCARVSIGFVRGGHTRVVAISHTAHFGRQMTLVRALGLAMDEAVDQRSSILFPVGPDEALASLAHADLAAMQHDGQIFTVPLFVCDNFVGAITFERARGCPFSPELVRLADVAATAIGPILEEKRLNDRWLVTKIAASGWEQVRRLLGPGHVARKLTVAAAIAIGLFFTFATGMDRVNSDAQIEGLVRRSVVSSYDGFIQTADVRAGDIVEAGQPLATLEDRELSLERLKWASERQQHALEYDRALASRQPATINVIRSQIEQADIQISLIDEQIARTRITAPIAGLVVSGDLSQRVGGAVSRGETLFEIAPLTGYRVVMQVDERRIASIHPGQTGEVVFTALPNEGFPVKVDKITPVAQTHDGRNLFKVEGSLEQPSDRLRPGMIGVAKLDAGQNLLIRTWLRPAADWLRLTFWRWWP